MTTISRENLPAIFNEYFKAHFYHILPFDRIGLKELENRTGTIFAVTVNISSK
jgi:hypothetical protein